ncbi:AAA family ATPase [Membranihabitans maritimus]|uniref:AAA family ATPase n=1 Tax=Membranihabitans maritimus TaxID=2904244 RepID=UPI0034E2468B
MDEYQHEAIPDEVHRIPNPFSYLQETLDQSSEKRLFIPTGSNNFLLQQSLSKRIAERVAFVNLLLFSVRDLFQKNNLPDIFFPKVFTHRFTTKKFHSRIGFLYIHIPI